MSSNLRSKSIQGYVTDSAGNILRNASIVIKTSNPTTGSIVIDSVKSDDNGYFISNPIPNGTYDIYESGIRILRIDHSPDQLKIQCYKPRTDGENYPKSVINDFTSLAGDMRLNEFKTFLQIEPDFVDVFQLGSSFPIYDMDITAFEDYNDALGRMSKFFELSSISRITTTRFDVEYYSPLTSLNSQYKRIRFAGVPGIKYFDHSKLLVPIDYYSLVASLPKFNTNNVGGVYYTIGTSPDTVSLDAPSDDAVWLAILTKLSIGDIIELKFTSSSWYGIVCKIDDVISLVKWGSSRFQSTTDLTQALLGITVYDGIFQSINLVDETNNERFSVVENVYAQDLGSELYQYPSV